MRIPLFACILGLVCISACQPEEVRYRVIDSSGRVEAEDLFTPVDTVRFDASVLIGTIDFVDLSGKGEFLLTDEVMRALHVFTASGDHIRTFKVTQCNPEAGGTLFSAKFLENGDMMVATSQGVYTFNADGSCKERLPTEIPNSRSFCERRDTVYFVSPSRRPRPTIHAYSIESGAIREYGLRVPQFPRTTGVKRGFRGRQIACFEHGVFYRYAESSDGEPLVLDNDPVVHRPMFYRPPKRDMTSQGGDRMGDLRDLAKEFTYSNALYALDDDHRLVTFEYPAEANMNIVNMDTQTSVSTSTDLGIMLAKDGLLYVYGDNERLSSGEFGNRTLEVWQFHPFDLSSTEPSK
ncbi:MAG: hypothetical protein OXH03_03575 [Bacteroidetes bacterium]|nr:hypothetical protein [Bacteroidota bacterium]MCY3614159.1 hypothetical protein [Bacteroidota bacterium]MDE2671121.1 hypothetical protein [Bacteroidota bacterium]MDE2671123.1 hypothetical protein [Bacteroidota bacterium]